MIAKANGGVGRAALNEYDNPYEVAPCTITLRRLVQFKNLGTSTVYLKSHTATRYIDCHGCAMTTKRMGAHGPVWTSFLRPPVT